VVGVLALGAVAGQALAQAGPGDEQARPRQEKFLGRVADKLCVTLEQLREAIGSTELEMLDEAVEEGKVRPEVAERLRQRIGDGRLLPPMRGARHQQPRLHPGQKLVLHAAAETLDMTPRELIGELRATGRSLAQLAEEKGVSREELRSGILEDVEKHLDEHLERLQENIDGIIDRTPGPPPAPPIE
jgi:hypothetical protein